MNKLLSFFLPFYRHSFETTLPKDKILKKIGEIEPYDELPYRSFVKGDRFWVYEKPLVYNSFGYIGIVHKHNSFVPIFSAKLIDGEKRTIVKANVRMATLINIVILPFYFLFLAMSAIGLIAFPINVIGTIAEGWELWPVFPAFWAMTMLMCLLFHFAFKRPSRKLVEYIEHLIYYDTEV